MTLQAISSAATIALAGTIIILIAFRSWQLISQPFAGRSPFRHSIMVEAAQRFRDELEKLRAEQSLYVTLTLIFVVIFGFAYLLRSEDTVGSLPMWKNIVVLAAVAVATAYGLYRFIVVLIRRRNVSFTRDANIAIGHGLQKMSANQCRVFHEVATPLGVIDNVVVGIQGVYAVSVVARRPGRNNQVRLEGELLSFARGDNELSLALYGNRAKQLAKLLKRETGHVIKVRPVVAVPGWEVESQASEQFLIVNERNTAMIRGWKDESSYLLNEDMESIQNYLTGLGTR